MLRKQRVSPGGDSLESTFGSWLRTATEPKTLSHVTGRLEALESILQSRTIWARPSTDVKGDDAELRLGEGLALEVAQELRKVERRSLVCAALDDFISSYSRERISVKAQVFIACFTPSIDQVHWNTYGNGATGFAMTFNLLPARQPDREVDHALVPVLYDLSAARTRIRDGFTRLSDAAQQLRSRATAGTLRAMLLRCAAVTAIQVKRRQFEAENEWRVAAIPHEHALHRVMPLPIKHIAIPLNPGGVPDIHEIRVGPQCEAPEAVASRIRSILTRCGYAGVPVRVG